MANNDPEASQFQPSMADVLAIVQAAGQHRQDGCRLRQPMKEGIALGIGAAAAAQEATDLNFVRPAGSEALARQATRAGCPSCGGPEMRRAGARRQG
jgi:hypothetical protein